MDRTVSKMIKKYEQIIINWLNDYAQEWSEIKDSFEIQVINDTLHHHYQIISSGWERGVFRHTILFHFQIKPDGKVWLLVNNTDILVTDQLAERGIPKSEMVIGFQPPFVRQHMTEYAVS